MKHILPALLLLSACSSRGTQDEIKPFDKDSVCSKNSLNYLEKKKSIPPTTNHLYTTDEIYQRLVRLEPHVRSCYEEEMARTGKAHSFNLCFVTGFNSRSQMDFFEFSTSEVQLTSEFQSCLAKMKNHKALQGLKELSILQPFRMFPIQ